MISDRLRDAKDAAADWWSDREPSARRWIIGGAVTAVVLVIGLAVIALTTRRAEPVRGDDPIALANYVKSHEFDVLPAEQKRSYMQSIRKHMAAIEAARREGQIDKKAYRAAYLCGWMERRLDDMHDYYKVPAAQRQAWLDKQLATKLDDGGGKSGAGHPSTKSAAPPATPSETSADGGLLYDDEAGKAKFEKEKDDFEDDFLDTWTAENKARWNQYRAAYKERRAALQAGSGAVSASKK